MKNCLQIISIVLAILFYQSGKAQTEAAERVNAGSTENWKTYSKNEFSVRYPSDWQLDKSGRMGTTFFVYSEAEHAGEDFRENVNLLIQDLSAYNIDLDEYASISKKQLNTIFPDAIIQEANKKKKNGLDYYKIIYSGTQNNLALKFVQYYWVINKKAYVLTFTAEQHKFTKYWSIAEKILDSFTFRL